MTLKTIIPATILPVSLAEAKRQCRIVESDTTHDERLVDLVWRAAASIESMTDCRVSSTTLQLQGEGFPCGDVSIPVYPVTSVSSVKYDDTDNIEQTMATSDYWAQVDGYNPIIRAVTAWPSVKLSKPASVRVEFVVGFTRDTLPNDLKLAILLRVGELFEQSTESSVGPEVFQTVNTVQALVEPHKKAYI